MFPQFNKNHLSHEDQEERNSNERIHDTEYFPFHGLGSNMTVSNSRHDRDGEQDAHVEGEVPGEVIGGVVARLAVGGDDKPLESVEISCDGLK